MFIHNKVMCIQQQNTLAKIHPAASIAIAPFVTTTKESKSSLDEDEHDVSSSMESETHSPIKEALTPGKTLPASNINRRLKNNHSSNSNSSSLHSDDESVQSNVVQKEVRFNQSVTARPSLHKNNYSADEFAATWYSNKEYDSIRRDLLKTLKLMQSGNFVECCDEDDSASDSQTFASSQSLNSSSSSHSFRRQPQHTTVIASARGLENFTAKGSLTSRVRKLREKAVLDVLVEQDFQVEQAESFQMTYLYYDADRIRDVYRKHSKIASEAAKLRGTADYRAANGLKPLMARPLTSSGRRHSIGSNMRKMFGLPKSSSERSVKAAAAAVAAFDKRQQLHNNGRPNRRWSLLSMPKTSKGLA